jgi:glycerol-3-phosphate dehydrogenase
MKVGLIGNGDRFVALAHLLRNHDVCHWTANGGTEAADLPGHIRRVEVSEFEDTPIIFLCLPVHRLRPAGSELGGVLSGRHVLVHTTRNLEPSTLHAPSTILAEETPTLRFGFLTGPFDADDALAGRPCSGVCASEFEEVHDLVDDALNAAGLRVYRAKDLRGAEAAAAYTRIIALLVGIGRQMELGESLEATLVTRGLAEAARFAVYRGGYEATAWGLSGCANLYLDISKQHLAAEHAHRRPSDAMIGAEFMRRRATRAEKVSESIRADFGAAAGDLFNLIESLTRVPQESGVDLPILSHAIELVEGRKSAAQVVESLLELPAYYE